MTRKNRRMTKRAISLLLCLLMLLLCIPISTVAEESLGRIEETTTEGPDETVIEPPMDANADTSLSTSQGSSTAHIISREEFERRKAIRSSEQVRSVTQVTDFSTGTYYLRSLYNGRMLYVTTPPINGYLTSTFAFDHYTADNSCYWQVEWQPGDTYVLKPDCYDNYGLVGNGSLYIYEIPEDGYTDAFHWYICDTGRGYLLKSFWTDEYAYYDGTQLGVSYDLPAASSADYDKFLWDFANVNSYSELYTFSVTNDRWMPEDSATYVTLNLNPSNASWSEYDEFAVHDDFLWATSNRDVAFVDSGYLITGDAGFATITAFHRATQMVYSFTVTVGQVISDGPYYIKNAENGKVIDVEGPSTSDGAYIQQWSFNNGGTQKEWQINYLGSGYYSVKSLYSNKYMSVLNSSTSSGVSIVQKTTLTDAGKWRIRRSDDGHFVFLPKTGESLNRVLTVPSDSTADGTNLKQVTYQYIDGEFWDEWELNSVGKTAIVIIPGMMGSELKDDQGDVWYQDGFWYWWDGVVASTEFIWLTTGLARMRLNENGEPLYDVWSVNDNNYGATDVYKSLYDALEKAYSPSCDVIFFDYDFRFSNTVSAQKLQSELITYSNVVLVAHSMGGLVASKYLAMSEQNRTKTLALISLGTPYAGSAKVIDVMYTGEMIKHDGVYRFVPVIKDVAPNAVSAYECFPTRKYYELVGQYPLMVNEYGQSNVFQALPNAAWGKKSDGSTKTMFNDAYLFQQSLLVGSNHIIHHEDVTTYTIAGTGVNTIISACVDENYDHVQPLYSNLGDESVMLYSAGYGTPDFVYALDHMALVQDASVIAQIKSLITQETGIAAQSNASRGSLAEQEDKLIPAEELVVNEKGWLMGFDNRRINVVVDKDAQLSMNDQIIVEEGTNLYDENGIFVGNVWSVGETKKMYILNHGDYEVSNTTFAKIEYMNNGYYEKIVEYSEVEKDACFTIGNYDLKTVHCEIVSAGGSTHVPATKNYTAEELTAKNQ